MKFFKSNKIKRDTKRVFLKKGTCSRTFFYLLNREFGYPIDEEEEAADPLAGGVVQLGYQCGMIWGASFALGAESYRRTGDLNKAVNMAIQSTRHVMNSFISRTNTPDCQDITETDWSKKYSIFKFMITGKMFTCFKLAEKWAPEAFDAAAEGLAMDISGLPDKPVSCASEVVRKMGGSEKETAIVAGLAGGMGLSGNGCGALGAAIWLNSLSRVREGNYKYTLSDTVLEKIIKTFYDETDFEMECNKICGRKFNSIKEHTDFIQEGGCDKLINVLASTRSLQ
ncbi:MAG: C-GCAxxG-C-C family protein [Candidatus Aminicenantes bacterium]|nr:C-GCAxxG-C-C family protein [Candidatus Aminicenantes bacterium]MCK5004360.1 C-GCAxxG-C-C family protein [Candidatus Aminicenantes bacterium]